jgi:molybdopterin synthase catalytic subunit
MPLNSPIINITVQQQDFDLAAEYELIRQQSVNPGAIAMFSGLVREIANTSGDDTGGAGDQSLTLEYYPGMTQTALRHIAEQAAQRWPLQACRVIHRVGTLKPADQIVLVACASAHRNAAFLAAQFIMDYLKTSAPFWKKQVAGNYSEWVESRESDYQARDRWNNQDSSDRSV